MNLKKRLSRILHGPPARLSSGAADGSVPHARPCAPQPGASAGGEAPRGDAPEEEAARSNAPEEEAARSDAPQEEAARGGADAVPPCGAAPLALVPPAAPSVAAVLTLRDPRAWVAFDLDTRAALRWAWRPWDEAAGPASPASSPRELADTGQALPGDLPQQALATALCHPDGRVREAAVLRAAGAPGLLPLVAVRCTDWVAPVRTRALALLRTALPSLSVDAFCDVAAVVARTATRRHGEPARDLVEQRLRDAGGGFLTGCLDAPDRRVQRTAAQVAVERGVFAPLQLALFAATGCDVVVQDRFARAAAVALPAGAATGEVLDLLLGSRQPRVRATGVTALHRLGLPDRAAPFLTDRAPVVRACARWVLRRHGVDPAPRYRQLCAEPDRFDRTTAAAAAGLGECGERKRDGALLRPLLAHPLPQVRAHAVAGLRALDLTFANDLLPLLDDPSRAVVRAATRALKH
ncbi:hypothetical protein ACQPZG_28140 [Streptomyces sp. CA-294286]|uniref:hypothetical protein n=1 Tax=Streptomyces sp. CA-294286 TaxID=3240070 RepID=UPI003D9144B4